MPCFSEIVVALSSGCDVFIEKPMTAIIEESRSSAALARRRGRSYAIMQNRRYLRSVLPIRDVIAAGVLGQIGIINADFRRGMDSPLILDMSIHYFDQARCMSGADGWPLSATSSIQPGTGTALAPPRSFR